MIRVDRTAPEIHHHDLWVPKTRPGMLSRRFAPRDRIGSGAQKYDRLLSEDLLNAEFAARALDLC
jgi:hypothetical protein